MKTFIAICIIGTSLINVKVNSQSPIVKVEGSGLPVVMIPGGNFSISVFDVHAKALSQKYKVIRFDRMNVIAVKTNTLLPENYSVRMESEAMVRKLDSLKINEPIALIGHSYGALIALDLALTHPDRIRSLVLVEPPAFWIAQQKNEHPEGMDEMITVTRDFGPNAQITELQLQKFRCALGNCPNGISARTNPQWNSWVKDMPYLRGLSAVAKFNDSVQRLHAFQNPVLIVTGNQTVAFHKRIDELLATELPKTMHVFLHGGHGACITNAVPEFIEAVKIFMEGR